MDDERELIARALEADPGAERALYDAHVDRIYRLAYRMTGDDDLAQEYTQQTFIRAFDRLATFRGEAKLSTWLHSIAVSVIYNGLRKVNRNRKRHVDLEVVSGLGDRDRAPQPYLRKRLTRAIDDLPQGYRTVFVMHEIEGYTHEEIAGALGVEVGTSKAQLSRARARLRKSLEDLAEEWAL